MMFDFVHTILWAALVAVTLFTLVPMWISLMVYMITYGYYKAVYRIDEMKPTNQFGGHHNGKEEGSET